MTEQKKTTLITGSIGGIGLGIAKAFAEQGFDIFLHGLIDTEDGNKIASQLASEYKINTFYKKADLRDKQQIHSLIETAENKLQGIGTLINNAGMQVISRVEDFEDQKWDDVIAIDLSAAFHTIKHSIPFMAKRKYGRIINIASVHGIVASENKAAYVAAKHGIIGLSKVVALENANTGITCNCICPGWVDTPLVRAQIAEIAEKDNISNKQAEEKLLGAKHPMKRFVSIEEIGRVAINICFTPSMTGSSIVLDCGWTSQ